MSHNTKFSISWVATAFVIIVLAIISFIGYNAGYRIGPNISLVKTRSLTITNLPEHSHIFTDYAPRGESIKSTLSIPLVPGTHMVLVTSQNYFPWTTLVTIPDNKNIKVRALLVPKAVSGTLLKGSEAKTALSYIENQTLPTIDKPLTLANGCALVSLSKDKRTIIATPTTTPSCTPPVYLCASGTCAPTIIYSPKIPPTAILAYPKHTDAFLVLVGKNLYALSLDPRSPRTFARVLHGISPKVASEKDGTVVVSDQSSVYTISL
ncbi:MAG TPA: hypothetical protein ENJ75_01695 [Candidatus Kaiserbacteria bacterium]|nr:hypothetical protein [Candidatus Kaiserbacteria bacterium]